MLTRGHVDGIFLGGCRDGDCEFRLGQQWVQLRTAGRRDPHLRKRVPRERLELSWRGRGRRMTRQLDDFQRRLADMRPERHHVVHADTGVSRDEA